jgi:tetratricopeptide (TPR) repeat protein
MGKNLSIFKIPYLILFTIFISLLPHSTFAETKTFVKEYTYQASEIDSKVSSRAIALEQVKRLLLEEVGVYLISETEVKDFKLTKDQVTVLTAGIVSAEIIEEKWDGSTYYMKAKIAADPDEVANSLKAIGADKQKTKELEESRKKANDALMEIQRLKKEIAGLKKSPKQQKEYAIAVNELSATDWLEKGLKFYESGNFKKALNPFNKAIQLNPQYAEAYIGRGAAYADLGNFRQAIDDFNKAIKLKPQAIVSYSHRGHAYYWLGNYQQTINDNSKIIELNPHVADAYIMRGLAYDKLGNYQRAIDDFRKATQLEPRDANTYIKLGLAYGNSGNYQQAINAYSKAIKLFPKYAEAYYRRGVAYCKLNNEKIGIEDVKIAAKLNSYEARDYLKQKGISW